MIIDMQPFFAKRGGNHSEGVNPDKLKAVIQEQRKLIDAAKSRGIPILLVQYAGIGRTSPELTQRMKGYPKLKLITKNTDGLFDPKNKSIKQVKDQLEAWKTDELIIAGANGGACVEKTIQGALREKYKVAKYVPGVADFNEQNFIYPFGDPKNEYALSILARNRYAQQDFMRGKSEEPVDPKKPRPRLIYDIDELFSSPRAQSVGRASAESAQ